MPLSQQDRSGILKTPLDDDVLVLSRFDAAETLGGLFVYNIEGLSEESDIDFNKCLGLNHSVTIKAADGLERYFNGVLVQARWTGSRDGLYVYQLVLMPWLWLLSHTANCRIFSQMTPKAIIAQVFNDKGFSDFQDNTTGSYPTLEYCVQYRESDMNFVCRLMEEYGIYYFFEHTESKHDLIMVDSKTGHKTIPGLAQMEHLPGTSASARRDAQEFDDWSILRGFQSGKFVLNDYNYEKPSANLVSTSQNPGGYAHDSMEMYDYPGRYDNSANGADLAKVRLEADQAKDQRRSASGYAPSLAPGYTITRTSIAGPASEDIEYLVLRCSHSFVGQGYRSSGRRGEMYTGSYELASNDRPFRSPQLTRKPVIQGPQTALVVGQQGVPEIDVDNEGRILVQFYWDRDKKFSRRVRVGQIWAGQYQKSLFIPRIGDEVIVQFLEGDPDRPLVVGSVYNATNVPPTSLPDNKTRSGINSESSSGHSGYNHFIFEDKSGQEFVKLRAQKDLIVHALNNETRNIDQDQKETIGGNSTQNVTGNLNQTVNQSQTLNVGQSYSLTAMEQISLTAMEEIVLTVGPSSITINPSGITLSAPMITLNAIATITEMAPAITVTAAGAYALTGAAVAITGATTISPALVVGGAIQWAVASGPPPVPA